MLHGHFKDELDSCFRMLAVDPRDVVEISGWFCAAQWASLGLRYSFTKNDLRNLMHNNRFQSSIVNSSLGRYSILHHFDAFYRLCSVTYKASLLGPQAKFFYRDYLSCSITDTSYFDETVLPSYHNGHVSCTLIHLAMAWAGDKLGTRDIFTMISSEVAAAHLSTLNYLGVSPAEFERYWDAVHYVSASSPMRPRPKVDTVVKVYTRMKAPKSMLLDQYARARNFAPEQLRKVVNPWEHVQKSRNAVLQESGMSVDEQLFNTGAYQISLEAPTDVIQTVFYKGRDDSRIEAALVRSEMGRLMRDAPKSLIVYPSPAFLVAYDEIRKQQWGEKKDSQPEVTFAVKDKTIAFLLSQQFQEE